PLRRPPSSPPFPYTTLFRSLRGEVLRAVAEADLVERGQPALAPLPAPQPRVEHRQLDVADDRGAREKIERLEDEPDALVADPGQDRKSTRLNSSHDQISYAV